MTPIRAGLWSIANWLCVEGDDYKWLALIVGVALAIRVMWVLVFQIPPILGSDAAAYDRLGWRLAQGQGYVTGDGTPTAYWPVGYPAFLAAIYMIFGYSWLAAGIASALLGTVSVVLTYRLAREFLSGRSSLVAAGTVALLPSHVTTYTSVLRNEMLHTALVLAALIAACHLVRHPNWKNAALLGLVIGVGLYVRPILILFPSVVALLVMIQGAEIRKSVGLTSITLLVSVLTISPWTARNNFAMGGFVLTSTSGADAFYEGNGPGATGEFRYVVKEDTFSDSSEMTVYREGIEMGLRHIISHPEQWIELLPKKFFHLWASDRYDMGLGIFPEGFRVIVPALWVIAQAYWTIIVIGATMAAVSRPILGYWLKFPAVLLPLTLLYWTAFHIMFLGSGRYHIQMIPVVAIIAVHLLERGRDWGAWLPARCSKSGVSGTLQGEC